jgi:hypothetical protein
MPVVSGFKYNFVYENFQSALQHQWTIFVLLFGNMPWRKLHNEELHNLYSSPDIIKQVKSRRMRWAGHVACMGGERKVYKVLVGKPEGRRPLGRPRHRWEDGIRMDLREIGLGSVDWIQLAQDRDWWRAVVSAVMNLRVLAPRSFWKYTSSTSNNPPHIQ